MSAYLYRLTMSLVTIDLWVLLKARRFAKFIIKLLSSILQVVFMLALGTGVFLTYTLAHNEIDMPVYADEYSNARTRPMKDRLIAMDSSSIVESSELDRKLENLKNQALNLELSLIKMVTHNTQ